MSGGCQCGAVRYTLFAAPYQAGICHCRMCQKAFGSFFAPLAAVRHADVAWTRGRPAVFRSSAGAERGFCRDCGTPLSFEYVGGDHISLAIGSLDEPARVPPTHADGIESRLPWFDTLAGLPGRRTEEDFTPEEMERLRSRQHPDGPPPS
ncbi:GFA family protein [Ancylobacter terrae]|uniref:GFA family protein n=1 Tax=Ancylobacter sp. sgz301288 TaxID=3342077 RepID=UPI00385F478E